MGVLLETHWEDFRFEHQHIRFTLTIVDRMATHTDFNSETRAACIAKKGLETVTVSDVLHNLLLVALTGNAVPALLLDID